MRIIEALECFEECAPTDSHADSPDDDCMWSHIMVLLQEGDQFYNARTSDRQWNKDGDGDISLLEIEPQPIPVESYCPPVQEKSTLAPVPVPQDCYMKQPMVSEHRSEMLLHEIRVCEQLKEHPIETWRLTGGVLLKAV